MVIVHLLRRSSQNSTMWCSWVEIEHVIRIFLRMVTEKCLCLLRRDRGEKWTFSFNVFDNLVWFRLHLNLYNCGTILDIDWNNHASSFSLPSTAGPFNFVKDPHGGFPTLHLNPYSWSKVMILDINYQISCSSLQSKLISFNFGYQFLF